MKFYLKKILLLIFIATLSSMVIQSKAQQLSLVWTWEDGRLTYDSTTLSVGGIIEVSLEGADSAELRQFLKQSKIFIKLSNGDFQVPEQSLYDYVKARGTNPEILITNGTFKKVRLLTGVPQEDSMLIHIEPFLGIKNGQPVVNQNEVKDIIRTNTKKSSPPNNGNGSGSSTSAAEINALKDKVSQLEKNIGEMHKAAIKKIEDAKLTNKQKKRLYKKLPLYTKADKAYLYEDCNGCRDHEGDLVYDFTCKEWLQATVDSNTVSYRLIDDLSAVRVKAQKRFKIRIAPINRFYYDISVRVDDSMYQSSPPAIFNEFFSGTGGISTAAIDAVKNSVSAMVEGPAEVKDELAKLLERVTLFQQTYDELVTQLQDAFRLCKTAECCKDNLTGLTKVKSQLRDARSAIREIEIGQLNGFTAEEANAKLKSLLTTKDECPKKQETLKAKIEELMKKLAAAKPDDKPAIEKELTIVQNDLKKLVTTCDGLDEQIEEFRKLRPLALFLEQIKSNLPSNADLEKIVLFDQNAIRDWFSYSLDVAFPQGDQLSVNIKTDSRDSLIGAKMIFMPPDHREQNLEFSVRNKLMFSFSSGPYFAFGGDLPVKSYGWLAIPAGGPGVNGNATYRLVQTGNQPLPLGIGGYANLGWKFTRNFGVAFTGGVGISLNQNALVSFMGGITPSFGDHQRFNITIGYGAAQVKEAQYTLYNGNMYAEKQALEYDKKMKPAFFLAISYSIFTSTSRLNILSAFKK